MTVYRDKRRERWVFDFRRKGVRHFGYCLDVQGQPVASRSAAVQAEGVEKRRAEVAPKLARAGDVTIAQVVADLSIGWSSMKSWPTRRVYIREIVSHFGPARTIVSISEADMEDYVTFALKQPIRVWCGGSGRKRHDTSGTGLWKLSGRTRSAASVNRYLPVLRAIFDRAFKMRDPVTRERVIAEIPRIKDLPEPKRKARPVPEDVLSRILTILPQHVREAMIATLLFGFRRTEIFSLTISDVDFGLSGIWLGHRNTKDAEDAFLPGSAEAMIFMRGLVDQAVQRGCMHLITRRRQRKTEADQAKEQWRPVLSPKRAWRTAMNTVQKFHGRRYRWHDLRAAYISRVANTCGRLAAQKLARHSDYRTTECYVLIDDDVLRIAADRAADRPALALVMGGKKL